MTMLLKVQQAQFTNVPFPFKPHPSLSTLYVLFQPSAFYAPYHFSYVLYNPSFFYAPPHLPSLPSPCSPSYSIRYLSSLLSHVPLHIPSVTFHPSPLMFPLIFHPLPFIPPLSCSPSYSIRYLPSFTQPYFPSYSNLPLSILLLKFPPFRSILPHSVIP